MLKSKTDAVKRKKHSVNGDTTGIFSLLATNNIGWGTKASYVNNEREQAGLCVQV